MAQADIVNLSTKPDGTFNWGNAMRGAMSTIAAADLEQTIALTYRRRVGAYYSAPSGGAYQAVSPQNNQLICVPFPNLAAFNIDRVGIHVTIAGSAGADLRLGLYLAPNDGSNTLGNLLHDFGTVDASSTGWKELTVAATVPVGLVWFTTATQGDPGTRPTVAAVTGNSPFAPKPSTEMERAAAATVGSTSTPGALPATFSSMFSAANAPYVGFRIA
jgi:hypothetical protein